MKRCGISYRFGMPVTWTACIALLILSSRAGAFQDSSVPAKTGNSQPAEARASSGDAKKGKQLYTSYGCYQCHGYVAQGATATGARLAPRPIPLRAFLTYIRQPTGEMPPYTAKLVPDSELRDIYAYLETIPQPSPLKDFPLLK
jgi:mono/diheme cytochrome c family protein